MMTIDEDKEFLKAQREKGRRGCMLAKDMSLAALESRRRMKQTATQRFREKTVKQQTLDETAQLASSSSSSAVSSPTCSVYQEPGSEGSPGSPMPGPSTSTAAGQPLKRPRAATRLVSPELAAAMDRTKMSNRDGVYVLTAAARSLGHNPEELVINRESFRKSLMQFRSAQAAEIKATF